MLVRSSAILALFVSSAMAFAPPMASTTTTSTRLAASKMDDKNMDDRRSFVTKVGAGKKCYCARPSGLEQRFVDDNPHSTISYLQMTHSFSCPLFLVVLFSHVVTTDWIGCCSCCRCYCHRRTPSTSRGCVANVETNPIAFCRDALRH